MTSVADWSDTLLARATAAGEGCWVIIGDSRTGMNTYGKIGGYNIANWGIGGITCQGWLAQWTDLAGKLGSCPRIDGAIINLGANDGFISTSSPEGIALPNTLAWLNGSVKAAFGKVLICTAMGYEAGVSTIVPDTFLAHAPYIAAVNVKIRKSASLLNLPLLDLEINFGGSQTKTPCTLDGIHPNFQSDIDTKVMYDNSLKRYYPCSG